MNSIDHQYIQLVNNITNNGYNVDNTRMLPMQFIRADNITTSFPVVKHKKLFVKGVWEELLFFLKGETDVRKLQDKGVHIWDANADVDYKHKHNKNLSEFDLGPIYGYQWRRFNVSYIDLQYRSEIDYSLQDVENNLTDQLQVIVNSLKNKSLSRRLFMSAWNPCQMDKMVLPPCHVSYHFIPYLKNSDSSSYTVDLMVYQRSADVMLGLPFNIASASFMLMIICKYCKVNAGNVCICIGNAHIYNSHFKSFDKVKEAFDNFVDANNVTVDANNVTVEIDGDISGSFNDFLNTVTYKMLNYNVKNKIHFDLIV